MIGVRNLAKVMDDHIITTIMQKNHFQRFTLVDIHQLESHHDHEAWKQEGWETEVHGHEPVGDDGTQRSAVVLELLLGVGPFSRLQVFQQALVGSSRTEEGNHSDDDDYSNYAIKASPRKKSVIVLLKIYCKPMASLNDLVLPACSFFCHFYIVF